MSVGRLLDLLLPPACAACGLPGPAACAGCLRALQPMEPPWCEGCGAPVPVPVRRCPACRGALAGARQAVAYSAAAPALVAALKDGRRRVLAAVLAGRIADAVPAPPPGAVLVPVPLGPRRLAARGFNQSLLIARELARRWGRPVAEPLARVREEPAQRGASATARARQAAGAFAPGGRDPAPAHAVLVDDVHTTGATLADCARALRAGGARTVGAACFARVVPGS
jgi:ComF family protein